MLNLAKRNILIFFRNKNAVFFSFMGVLVVIGLYLLFLGDTYTSNYEGVDGVREIMDNWVMAGMIAVSSITTTMGAFGAIVQDREKHLLNDMSVSPLKRRSIAGGYIISSYVIGVIMSVFTFILAEVYIVFNGGELPALKCIIEVLGIILLGVFSSSAMVFFVVSFFRTSGAFATASTILGTLAGFLTGIYVPVGYLPKGVQWIVKCFPVTHIAALIKQVMTKNPMEKVFDGAPQQLADTFAADMGIRLSYGSYTATVPLHLAVLVFTGLMFSSLAVINLSRKEK